MIWFLIVLVMVLLLFADMMHMVIFKQLKSECMEVDLSTEFDSFADFCSDTLLRNSLRLFASIAGGASLDNYWSLGSIQLIILWMLFMFIGVIILLNVLIAIATESYHKSTFK